jgi:hypothetical protein
VSYLRSCCKILLQISTFSDATKNGLRLTPIAIAVFVFVLPCIGQQHPQAAQPDSQNPATQSEVKPTITIPAGTRISLVLTQPVQSRYVRRGDDVFAQVLSPVDVANHVVIPAGTFVQGSIDRLERRSRQGELRLQSLSITFPDGFVTPISGPITLHSDQGYALKDPGSGRMVGGFAIPAAGAGVGALIGHSLGSSQSTMTTTLPAGCNPALPNCLSSSMPVPGTAARDTVIGAGVGAAAGMVASMALLFGSHHFYLVAGAPIQMTLQQPVMLQQDEVARAVRDSAQHPVPVQPIAPLPVYVPPYPDMNAPPPTPPSTPPTIIPGPPGPNGVPGPPIVIPGTPQGS